MSSSADATILSKLTLTTVITAKFRIKKPSNVHVMDERGTVGISRISFDKMIAPADIHRVRFDKSLAAFDIKMNVILTKNKKN
ncbi:hypothetical protein [Jeotgalibacillus marinus]|uniref:Uncharacterized protein n=1 Tax=Jeotgalibacillus marinus TaxID=86667 RepID=A0ABV3Q4Z0_9BACL